MDTAVHTPLSQRINFRMIVFVGVILLMIGFPLYWFLQMTFSGGTVNRGDYIEVDLYWLSNFEMDQSLGADKDIPFDRKKLDGKRVQLIGEMYTSRAAVGRQSEFDLVYSIARCCFTGQPKIQHFVKSTPLPGKKIQYYPNLVRAIGVLHVGVEKDAGQIVSVYRLDVESTQPAN